MRKMLLGVVMLMSAAAWAQDITVSSRQGQDIDFTEYKTFDWADQVDNQLDSGHYFLNDLIFKAQIREAVRNEMMAVGYEFDDNAPDLVVNFRVFDKAATISGPQDFGDDYWGAANYKDVAGADGPYEVEAGTLLISLIDKESGAIVWHGFASGLIDNDQFIKDEGKVIQAVNMIFQDFNQNAYSRR